MSKSGDEYLPPRGGQRKSDSKQERGGHHESGVPGEFGHRARILLLQQLPAHHHSSMTATWEEQAPAADWDSSSPIAWQLPSARRGVDLRT